MIFCVEMLFYYDWEKKKIAWSLPSKSLVFCEKGSWGIIIWYNTEKVKFFKS
jgi:hypothetical protein